MKQLIILASMCFCIYNHAQVGIGTEKPDKSAMLDIDVSDLSKNNKKGFLGPRVALMGKEDKETIPNPVKGLLVYNLGTDEHFKVEGYMVWDGEEWGLIEIDTIMEPSIEALDCSKAVLIPETLVAGKPYTGTLIIPYIGGNRGSYSTDNKEIPSTGNTGLKAVLQSGKLNSGNGTISYNVSGVPVKNNGAPFATFDINFLSHTCSVEVGQTPKAEIETVAFVGLIAQQEEDGIQLGDFKFRIARRVPNQTTTNEGADPEIMYVGKESSIVLNGYANTLYKSGHYDETSGGNMLRPHGAVVSNTDTMKPNEWYAWGNNGFVTLANSVEKRNYTFTTNNPNDHTFYRIEWTGMDPTPTKPSGDPYQDMKVVIYVEEVVSR